MGEILPKYHPSPGEGTQYTLLEEQSDEANQSGVRSWSTVGRRVYAWVVFVLICITSILVVPVFIHRHSRARLQHCDLTGWINNQETVSLAAILKNIGPAAGAIDGLIIASPSRKNPDYYYTWTRDSALTMSTLIPSFLEPSNNPSNSTVGDGSLLEPLIRSYVASQQSLQVQINPSGSYWTGGIGEPKFNVDGTPFTGSWGRPQRDGAALRALALIPYANFLLNRGFPADLTYVSSHLYNPHAVRLPTAVIKSDLEYIANRWNDQPSGFDLWEETRGTHFFTLKVSRLSLLRGAELADTMGDYGAARYYRQQVEAIGEVLLHFWDSRGYIRATLENVTDGYPNSPADQRTSLDCAVPLAIIHGTDVELGSDRVLATIRHFVKSFDGLYEINRYKKTWTSGLAVGRYPEDVYDGDGKSKGNPWYLCTFSVAHVIRLAIGSFIEDGKITITDTSQSFWRDVIAYKDCPSDRDACSRAGSHGVWTPGRMTIFRTSWALPSARLISVGDVLYANDPSSLFSNAITALEALSDRFVIMGRNLIPSDGSLSEQIDRLSGDPAGAGDLTWSYASLVHLARLRRLQTKNVLI